MNKTKIASLRQDILSGRGWRYVYLAYALLRGRPYRLLELVTREDNRPSLTLLADTAGISVDEAEAWLSVPATPELLERAAKAREAFLAAKRARYAEVNRATA